MSWCRARGQPMGAGRRYPSSTELMTWGGGRGQAQCWAGGRPPPFRPTRPVASAQPGSWTHITVCHVPVGPLPIGQHLPHDHTEAPHVAGRGEGPESDGLRGCPADRDLASLQDMPKCRGLLPGPRQGAERWGRARNVAVQARRPSLPLPGAPIPLRGPALPADLQTERRTLVVWLEHSRYSANTRQQADKGRSLRDSLSCCPAFLSFSFLSVFVTKSFL